MSTQKTDQAKGNTMTARDFCYWLQGVFEVGGVKQLDERQTDLVRRHLALVFAHEIDPSAGPPEHQKVLDAIHAAAGTNPATAKPPQIGGHGPDGIIYRC